MLAPGARHGTLAVITSAWFFDEVVRHSTHIDPTLYRPARIQVKETDTTGWIGLPDAPDPAGNPHTPPAAPENRGGVPLHQLPACPRDFAGRTRELAALTDFVSDAAGHASGLAIAVIGGAGGIGKTALALYWAWKHVDLFPDGQLFLNLRGFDPSSEPMTPGAALRSLLVGLGVEPAAVPADLDEQAALYRGLVAGRRILILLDNAYDSPQLESLLSGSPTCTVVITSRRRLVGMTVRGARSIDVDPLTTNDANTLLSQHIGAGPRGRRAGRGGTDLAVLRWFPPGTGNRRSACRPALRLLLVRDCRRTGV